jgi:hypothetical protein
MTAQRAARCAGFTLRWFGRFALVWSLIGFVITCVLWARSRQAPEVLARSTKEPGFATDAFLHSAQGLVLVQVSWRREVEPNGFAVAQPTVSWSHRRLEPPLDLRIKMRAAYDSWGFACEVQRPRYESTSRHDWRHYRLMFPHWAAVIALGVPALGLIWPIARHARTRRRARRGLCRACGYDLRATPRQCPECGALAGAP